MHFNGFAGVAMGLIRLILLILLIYFLLRWVTRFILQSRNEKMTAQKAAKKMVRCDYCGVFVPQSEALEYQGKYYCSKSHLELAHKDHP